MRKIVIRLGGLFLALVILINLFAWNHAKAMLEFSRTGKRTGLPETLSFSEKLGVALFGVNIPKPQNTKCPGDFGLAFDTYRFPNGLKDTLEAWYIPAVKPKGIVLLFHGYCSSKAFMLPLAKELNALGYSSFLVDFYGSGGSTGNSTSVGYFEAKDVAASYYLVKENWPGSLIIPYGYSMGGAALVRAISAYNIKPDGVILESVFGQMLGVARNRIKSLGVSPFLASELFVFWGGIQQGFNGFRHNPADYAFDVKCPTMILHGQGDDRVKKIDAETLYNNLKGQKQLVVFDKAGHDLKLKNNRLLWIESVKGFLVRMTRN